MDSTLQLIINIGAVTAAVTAIIGLPVAFVKLWPLLKRGVTITASLETLPEMALELRGLAQEQRSQGETLTTIKTDVDKVKQQVKNDHDSNLREDLDAVHKDVRGAVGEVRAIHQKLDAHLNQSNTTVNINGGTP